MDEYLKLEARMLASENEDEADYFRDLMDPLWLRMTDEEHEFLDSRGIR